MLGNHFSSSMIPRTAFSTSATIFSMPCLGKNSTIDLGSKVLICVFPLYVNADETWPLPVGMGLRPIH